MPKAKPKPLPISELNKERTLFALLGTLFGFLLGFVVCYAVYKPWSPNAGAPAVRQSAASSQPGGQLEGEAAGGVLTDAEARAIINAADQQAGDFEVQMDAGNKLYAAKRYVEAARLYERAHQLRPNDDHSLAHTGNAYFDAKEWEKASVWYEMALVINPRDVNVRTDYGLTFWYRTPSQPEKAIEQYRKSLEIEPGHALTLQNLAVAQVEGLHDVKGGLETLARLEETSPGNPLIRSLRTRIKELSGK